jgi:hypothetical protein
MIRIDHRLPSTLNVSINMPDPERIANNAVRSALELAVMRYEGWLEAHRQVQGAGAAAAEAKNKVRSLAADAAFAGAPIPLGLRSLDGDAAGILEDAKVAMVAAEDAYTRAWQGLVAAIDANRETWRATLLKDADRALNFLAAARKSLEAADAEATAVFGVLTMLDREPENGYSRPVIGAVPQEIHVSQAMPHLTDAIGSMVSTIGKHRGQGD